ncbi:MULTISPECIES: trehalose-phosphatase [Halorussus]|uniref:trehalose-phosphatase n=1 Tax=Halorussus TaxID=1070314 RepID=UPI00209FBDE4|nr:trehalose-phosphatase [Halorussus vallis]USZ74667.1 trehalose-phosphatase [Halorussus vallis]
MTGHQQSTPTDSTSGEPDDEPAISDDVPPLLRENLHALVEKLAARDGLLVLLDFDGTLASIERRPDEASLPDPTRTAVERLTTIDDVEVAVVSGRGLSDLRERVDIPGLSYAGNHGLELRAGGETEIHPEAREAEDTIDEICDVLARELADIDGAFVEHKGVTATVHTRLVADDLVPTVENLVEELVAAHDDVRLTTGKDVLELRPRVEWDKGEAVRWLYDELVPDGERWFPIYLGDDTTDEAAFRVLADEGVGIKVGDHPPTDAPYRVSDPEAVREMLSWLATYGVEFLHADSDRLPVGA